MLRPPLILLLAFSLSAFPSGSAAEEPPEAEEPGVEDSHGDREDAEAPDIIPRPTDLHRAAEPVTPVTVFPERRPYDQARACLIEAQKLWLKKEAEAASDKALEAYDDLVSLGRVRGVPRKRLRQQRRLAAQIYIDAGIAYIHEFVRKGGGTAEAAEEGISRLEDLRGVAQSYPELTRKVNRAKEKVRAATPPR